MRTFSVFLCDKCDRFAGSFAIDLEETTKPADEWASYRPIGEEKAGCFMHPAVSTTVRKTA